MKMKQLAVMCGLTVAILISAGSASAQDNAGQQGGGGGGRGPGGGRGGWGDPAQMQQRALDGVREQLGFTNDAEWEAVSPLVSKDLEAVRDSGGDNMMRMMRLIRGNRGGGQGGPGGQGGNRRGGGFGGGFGGTPSPEADNLQKAIDDNAPSAQVKELLTKYQASIKAKKAKLKDAQEALRQVLTAKQEAQATLLGLLD